MLTYSSTADRFNRFLYSLFFAFIAYFSISIEWAQRDLGEQINYYPKYIGFPFVKFIEEILIFGFDLNLNTESILMTAIHVSAISINVATLQCFLSKSIGDEFILNKMHTNKLIAAIAIFFQWVMQLSGYMLFMSIVLLNNRMSFPSSQNY